MSKFNIPGKVRAPRSGGPVTTLPEPTTRTHEGAPAHVRDTKGELFVLALSYLAGEDTFYESADARDARFRQLVRDVAVADPQWMLRFVPFLRTDIKMRSGPVVAACQAVHARLEAGQHGDNRALIASALRRADEPGELLAYWISHFGRSLPMPVKRGVGDAARRLYREYQLLKYDTGTHAVRFADVLELTHPSPIAPWQGALFRHAVDRRHGNVGDIEAETLPMVAANGWLRNAAAENPELLLDPERLRAAGMTWEDALSLAGSRVDKARLWEALIPVMGLFALVRNLRNFDQAGVSDDAAQLVTQRLSVPDQVAKSGIFPYQWLAAYREAPSLRWSVPLNNALTASLSALPKLPGRTLILIDTSASMRNLYSRHGTMTPVHTAAVFGVALAAAAGADLYGFADGTFEHKLPRGGSLIREVDRFAGRIGEVGHGTMIASAIRSRYAGHDRVFVFTDEQTMDRGAATAVPADVPLYGFNLGGYRPAVADWGRTNRIQLGGVTDATFRLIPLIEAGRRADWDAAFGSSVG